MSTRYNILLKLRNYQRELLAQLLTVSEAEKPAIYTRLKACGSKLKIFLNWGK
jgi:hypothetical protein